MLFKKIKKLSIAEEIQNRYKIVLDNQGIAIIEPGSFREKTEICERTLACYLILQLVFDIVSEKDYLHSRNIILEIIRDNSLEQHLTKLEKRLLYGNYQMEDVLNIVDHIEVFYGLLWIIGLIDTDNMLTIDQPCNIKLAINSINDYSNIKKLIKKSKIRSKKEIIEMHDLFAQIHTIDYKDTNIIKQVVDNRLIALKWILTQEKLELISV